MVHGPPQELEQVLYRNVRVVAYSFLFLVAAGAYLIRQVTCNNRMRTGSGFS
jgi:hypothetical protein